jgi:hypothetical protein
MTTLNMIYPELGEKTNAQIEFTCSYNGGYYLTTDLLLNGRGIKMTGDGSSHQRNKKTYQVTEKAFKVIKSKYTTCFIANL